MNFYIWRHALTTQNVPQKYKTTSIQIEAGNRSVIASKFPILD